MDAEAVADAPAPAPRGMLRGEFPFIARHAVTVLTGQLAVMAFGVTDTVVAGRHSDTALAALSVGSAIFVSVYVALMGVLQALLPVWAQQRGAGQREAVGRSVRQALYIWGFTSVIGMALLMSPGPLLRWADVPPALRDEAGRYLSVLGAALPAALMFRLYGTLNQSLGHPRLVTWLQLGSLALKIPLSIVFVLGAGPLPAQGAVGCAWATLVVNYLLFFVALWLARGQALYRPYALWRRLEPPDWRQLAAFARLGVPAGLSIMVEVTSFTLMAIFIARQGTTSAAAHQIAASMAAMLYMVPLSIAIATSARTGYWLGAGSPQRARHAAGTGLALSALMALCLSATVFTARGTIAGLYSRNPAVAALAAGLLAWVAVYHLADAMQCVCVFVLRCYRITVSALVVYCVLLWGVGLGGGYGLAYRGWYGPAWNTPVAFWMASAAALALTAVIFLAIVCRAVRRPAR
jgi:MATE family multidrug resistance protein